MDRPQVEAAGNRDGEVTKNDSKLTKSIMAVVAVTMLALSFAGCSGTTTRGTTAKPAVAQESVEDRLIYSRAFEAILWANPMLAVSGMAQESRDLGAGNTDVIYTGETPDSGIFGIHGQCFR